MIIPRGFSLVISVQLSCYFIVRSVNAVWTFDMKIILE